jgi:Flp pilus assembly protein TadD
MTVKGTAVKLIIFALLCGVFTYLVPACSTGKHLTAFSSIGRAAEAQSGMTDDDLSKLMSQLRPHPGNAGAHYQLGCWYQDRSRYEEAIKEFKKALYIKPDYTEAYNGLGVAYDRKGEYAAASDAYRIALKLNPNLAYIYNNLGHSYILQGKNREAIDTLKQALALGYSNNRVHNNLGLAYALSGQLDLAMQEFEQAGNKALAHSLVAKLYYQKGQFEKAKKHYNEALAFDPNSVTSSKGLETSTALAKFDEVLAQLKQAVEAIMPGEPDQTQASGQATGSAPKNFANVDMEVSNGNGVKNMAKSLGHYLKERGFNVVRLTNADRFSYAKTTLMYRPECNEATRELAEKLPEIPAMQEVKKFDRPNIRMKMVLGRDLVPHKDVFLEEKK